MATNNAAEYQALIWGLEKALALNVSDLVVLADSELMVRQLTGEYRVKNAVLKEYYGKVKDLSRRFARLDFQTVPREKNKLADRLVNQAIDAATADPLFL